MSRFARQLVDDHEEHDVSKELFLGIMMLMLCLGIMILNVASPVWRVHQHEPKEGDTVVLYTVEGMGLSEDGNTLARRISEAEFRNRVRDLIANPQVSLFLVLKGGSKERLVKHAAYADSLLSGGADGTKVRTAVYVQGW